MERIDKQAGIASGAPDGAVDEVDLIPVRTYWQLVRQRFAQHRLAVIALVLMIGLVALAVIVPTVSGEAYTKTSLTQTMLPPSLAHPLGTNQIGQDMFLRLMKALQTSLFIGFMAVLIIATVGVTLGAVAGFYGGWVDNVIMRLVDVVLALPIFFLIVMIVAFFGKGDAWVVIFAIGLTGWTLACRLIRAEFLKLRESDFVQAARALGAGDRRIIARHILPAALAPVVRRDARHADRRRRGALSPSASASACRRPACNMLKNFEEDLQVRPVLLIYLSVTIVLVVLAASFLGDGLRDALDPRQRIEA
jgi:peptide/nickel transport system permease protein